MTKAQQSSSLSSCEAETVAMGHAATEIVDLRSILQELGFGQSEATTLHCDNTGAIAFPRTEEITVR